MGADSEALHAIRRGVRRLRYLAELSAQLTGGSSDAPRLLKGLQDALGHVHDQHVLATWLTAHAGRARARGATGLGRASARLKTRVEQARRRLHQAYLNRRPLNIVSRAMTVSGIVLPEPLMLGRATMKAG
jgi:CHAD domain-containing protein